METRGAYTLIGSFVVLGFIAMFALGIWLTGAELDQQSTNYQIFIEESVSGLEVGSRVKYRGISAGRVKIMEINKDNPQQVRILAEIDNNFPIFVGDIAALSLEGITGNAVINIQGAVSGAAILQSASDNPATIPSRPSDIEQLLSGAPELINQGNVLAQRVADLFNQENRDTIGNILRDIETLTGTLSSKDRELDNLVTTMDQVAMDIQLLSASLNALSGNANLMLVDMRGTLNNVDQLFSSDGRELIKDWQQTAKSLNRIAENADGLLANNKDAINDFTTQGLRELTAFLHDGRILLAGLSRILDKLESSGARFLLNKQDAEYTPN
jgi:phospholipid/cholesterol/gamma-HCH transport system substrate-binding protein